MARILLGKVMGPQGEQGKQGPKGDPGNDLSKSALDLGDKSAGVTSDNIFLNPPIEKMIGLHHFAGEVTARQGGADLSYYHVLTMVEPRFHGEYKAIQVRMRDYNETVEVRSYIHNVGWNPWRHTLDTRDLIDFQPKSSLDLGDKSAGVISANIFINPPLDKMGAIHRFCGHFEPGMGQPLNDTIGWWEVITFASAPTRAIQIAVQAYQTGELIDGAAYIRTRHIDNDDYSLWKDWHRVLDERDLTNLQANTALNLGNQVSSGVTASNIILDPPLEKMGAVHNWYGDLTVAEGSPNGNITNYNIITTQDIINGTQRVTQTAVSNAGGSSNIYLRTKFGDIWEPWHRLLDERDLITDYQTQTSASDCGKVLIGGTEAGTYGASKEIDSVATKGSLNLISSDGAYGINTMIDTETGDAYHYSFEISGGNINFIADKVGA